MRRSAGQLVVTILALAFGALLVAGCEGSDGGTTDVGGGGSDVTAGDTGGGGSGGSDSGAVTDLGCVPSCAGRNCGDDGCGGTCGTCGDNATCTNEGVCVCEPACGDRVCGLDPGGCGVSCGTCDLGTICEDGACVPGGDLTCVAYFVCIDGCDATDAECPTTCRTAVADAEGDLTDRVAACFETSCATCEDLDCLRDCGLTNCGQDYVDCFSGDATCYDIYACVDACYRSHTYGSTESNACRADCLATGTVEAQNFFHVLEDCVRQEGGCDPADMAEYEACERRARNVQCSAQNADCPQNN